MTSVVDASVISSDAARAEASRSLLSAGEAARRQRAIGGLASHSSMLSNLICATDKATITALRTGSSGGQVIPLKRRG